MISSVEDTQVHSIHRCWSPRSVLLAEDVVAKGAKSCLKVAQADLKFRLVTLSLIAKFGAFTQNGRNCTYEMCTYNLASWCEYVLSYLAALPRV
jgi:hypothetical protein